MSKEQVQAAFGRNFRAARLALDLSQAEVESLTGIKQHHISAIERGLHDTKHSTMQKLARAVGKTVADLLTP